MSKVEDFWRIAASVYVIIIAITLFYNIFTRLNRLERKQDNIEQNFHNTSIYKK